MNPLPPWAQCPFDLLCHAERHFCDGEDFDRRMALISFDNSIEFSIAAYLSLKPIHRQGREYDGSRVKDWLTTYAKRLQFLEAELQVRGLDWTVPKDHVSYVHERRNELYHEGKAGVPEQDMLDLARKAAIWVYSELFGVPDVQERLEVSIREEAGPPSIEKSEQLDDAIDGAFEPLRIGSQTYRVSMLLFEADPDAYKSVGQDLLGEENQENDDPSAGKKEDT